MTGTTTQPGITRPVLSNPHELYIDGGWKAPADARKIQVVSPHNEEVIEEVAAAGNSDVDIAVAAAREAFDHGPWPRLSPHQRAEIVGKLGDMIAQRLPEVAGAWVDQVGTLASVAPFVIPGEHGWFDYYVRLAENFEFESEVTLESGGKGFVIREPAGVAAIITPWNNPYGTMIGKLIPALIAGCTVIMKPAPETPIEAYLIAEAADKVGLPPGVLNLLPAERSPSEYLVSHDGVDKVSFTGSVAAGKRIAQTSGANLTRYTLELGGKSAAVVLDDYDIEAAAATLAQTITMSAGQVCAALSRVLISKKRQPALLEALHAELDNITVGNPYDSKTMMGPLAMSRQRDRVEHYIASGRTQGATLVRGGRRPAHLERGYYIEPTLFGDVDPEMTIAHEEIFGPVLSVLTFEDEADAISKANATSYGLYGAVFTQDDAAAYRIARGMRAGTIAHNNFLFDRALPFGGFKDSGVGREGGEAGLLSFTEAKSFIPRG